MKMIQILSQGKPAARHFAARSASTNDGHVCTATSSNGGRRLTRVRHDRLAPHRSQEAMSTLCRATGTLGPSSMQQLDCDEKGCRCEECYQEAVRRRGEEVGAP